ncbi:hypothetical protein CPB86DRAFT_770682 [Serendipita vermifera]|nr:hypothetical protein CPB86DRAFT_770682 [Serendipita vermifera]
MPFIVARYTTPDPVSFQTCIVCDRVFSRKTHLERHKRRRNPCIDDIIRDNPPISSLSQAERAAMRKAERRRINKQNYLRHQHERQKKAREYSRRSRGRQGSLTKEELGTKLTRMSWRRMLRAVYWDSMDEEEICSKAEDITRALQRTGNDPNQITDRNLKVLVRETYKEVDLIFVDYPHLWDRRRRIWVPTHYKEEESDGEPDITFESIYRLQEDASDFESCDE